MYRLSSAQRNRSCRWILGPEVCLRCRLSPALVACGGRLRHHRTPSDDAISCIFNNVKCLRVQGSGTPCDGPSCESPQHFSSEVNQGRLSIRILSGVNLAWQDVQDRRTSDHWQGGRGSEAAGSRPIRSSLSPRDSRPCTINQRQRIMSSSTLIPRRLRADEGKFCENNCGAHGGPDRRLMRCKGCNLAYYCVSHAPRIATDAYNTIAGNTMPEGSLEGAQTHVPQLPEVYGCGTSKRS